MSDISLNNKFRDKNLKELSFYKLKDEFYTKYALLHSSHLMGLIPSFDRKNYFFIIKKRYIYLLTLAFSSKISFLNKKSDYYWEFRSLIEELLLWKETTNSISLLSMKYRGHHDYLSFLTLVNELKEEKKKSRFSSFFPNLKLSH